MTDGLATADRPAASGTEQPVVFECQGERLLGVLHPAAGRTGVVIVVGGPQYRTGSHRLFVDTARALAQAGYPTLRFDLRGMGDSSGAQRTFEDLDDDIDAAIAQLQRLQTQVGRVVLWGLCDGASAAVLYLDRRRDARVSALALLNPWVRSETTLARTQVKHYYGQRLLQASFWLKLVRGGVGAAALKGFAGSLVAGLARGGRGSGNGPDFRLRMARQWRSFQGPVLLMLSSEDYTAREFEECVRAEPDWTGALDRPLLQLTRMAGADHTLAAPGTREQMLNAMLKWLPEISRSR